MEARIIKSSELGLNCWKPLRFFKKCYQCDSYVRCGYPEKVVNEEYERLLKAEEWARKVLKKAREDVRVFKLKNR